MHIMKKNNKIITGIIIAICFAVIISLFPSGEAEALTPRVMMTEYSLSKDVIYPGDDFKVSITLKNTSRNKIMNLKASISSDNGEFLPLNGTGSSYIAEINGEAEEELEFGLQAVSSLEDKSYKLKLKIEYEDWSKGYTVNETIYVPVKQKTEVMVTDTYIAEEEIRLGDNIEIVSTINNVGGADIYKVKATASGENISEATTYVGNIKAGKSANIDIITAATALARIDRNENKIVITYEDIDGNEYSEKVYIGNDGRINVIEQDFSDIIQVKQDTRKKMTDIDKLLIIIASVVVLVILFIVIRVLKRKKIEREFD